MALLDIGGHLSVCSLSTSSMKSSTIRKYDRKDIWNLVWARDNPNLLAIMEKTRMYEKLLQNVCKFLMYENVGMS